MTTEQLARGVGLEEVRARFLDAEQALADANRAITSIQAASAQIGEARASVTEAAANLGALAGSLGDLTATLGDNAIALREGVDAIRLGDPAEVRRMLSELDAAFSAHQATMSQRLDGVEATQRALADQLAMAAQARARHFLETRLAFAIVFFAVIAVAVISVIR